MNFNDMTSYELLEMFSQLQSHSSFDRKAPTWTPRLLKIKEILDYFQIKYVTKHYVVNGFEDRYFTNFYISFGMENDNEGILFLAHHDINNEISENCQDNTSSVCHILEMIKTLKDKPLSRPVHFALVDSEEHVNLYCCGSQVLSEDIHNGSFGKLDICINLELTGLGEHIWASNFEKYPDVCDKYIKMLDANKVATPFNDAYVLAIHDVPSMCIGILDDKDIKVASENTGYPYIWALCHSMEDTFDKISKEDMHVFQNKLINLI
jgi:hypothetical protein